MAGRTKKTDLTSKRKKIGKAGRAKENHEAQGDTDEVANQNVEGEYIDNEVLIIDSSLSGDEYGQLVL